MSFTPSKQITPLTQSELFLSSSFQKACYYGLVDSCSLSQGGSKPFALGYAWETLGQISYSPNTGGALPVHLDSSQRTSHPPKASTSARNLLGMQDQKLPSDWVPLWDCTLGTGILTGEKIFCRGISLIALLSSLWHSHLPSLGVACSFVGKKKNHLPPVVNEFRL